MKPTDLIYKNLLDLTDGLVADVATLVIGLIVLMFLVTAIHKLLLFFNNFHEDNPLTESKKRPLDHENVDGGLMGRNHKDLF